MPSQDFHTTHNVAPPGKPAMGIERPALPDSACPLPRPYPLSEKGGKGTRGSTSVTKGWLGRMAFADVLRRERHRSDRSGSPFCLVVFEMPRSQGAEDGQATHMLLEAITAATRDYDVRALLDWGRIGVLLLDTPFAQARLVVDKILLLLCEAAGGPTVVANLQGVRITSYPPKRGRFKQVHLRGVRDSVPEDANRPTTQHERKVGFIAEDVLPLTWDSAWLSLEEAVMGTPLFLDLTHRPSLAYRVGKRALDIFGATVGLVLAAPLMAGIAAVVKLTSKGPALFKQQRIGHKGRPFTMFKFRTMRVSCDDTIHRQYVRKLIQGKNGEVNFGTADRPLYKLANDPRITTVGHFLRRRSLDELPQLVNVLLGQMSLVGPRPPLPFEVESYNSWHLRRILEAKPGITGMWQVYGRSSTTFNEMVRLDLLYARQRSLLLDIKLILKTLTAVVAAKGAL